MIHNFKTHDALAHSFTGTADSNFKPATPDLGIMQASQWCVTGCIKWQYSTNPWVCLQFKGFNNIMDAFCWDKGGGGVIMGAYTGGVEYEYPPYDGSVRCQEPAAGFNRPPKE